MKEKHSNVAIFVPHNGCKNNCSFCNQKTITGKTKQASEEDVKEAVETALDSGNVNANNSEIAFFGGSFTAIERNYMESLLKVASKYVEDKLFRGIRISTRPDCIDEDILNILKKYNVTSIELGAQSMDDEVLQANMRGHTAQDVEDSSKLIKQNGFSLGLQMMTGLYKASEDIDINTAEKIIKLKPDTLRIYPTVVLDGTYLSELYKSGKYKAVTLNEAVNCCADLLRMFEKAKINVIKIGLHSSKDVEKEFVAGAYHPAFRELVEAKMMCDDIIDMLSAKSYDKNIDIYVNPNYVSKLTGQKKCNIKKLNKLGYKVKIIQDISMKKYNVKIKNSR